MKNSKTKKLSLQKLKIAKLDNINTVHGGSIIITVPIPPVESDIERECPGDTKGMGCQSMIRCVILGR
ncbi:hypothetical protein D1816_15795 [Aquimarina sp. AD10]|uniref:Uncharacterized protein n=1 Tax=Aquimarina aggregata TaxID=1642818 RepID=A0A162CS42_9FLAO|nr:MULTISPECIES: hypothetical protein [Aquimarina]AXT61754.1 hypothetical protein D1816_15795 [Aquimarina sp. AD10]KZS41354.1 hypothetical protein AWE51_21875 [Aquimarina aggregata]RKN00895.1 hypothetical protein D7033_05970 [Aquimarina sp. AD10]